MDTIVDLEEEERLQFSLKTSTLLEIIPDADPDFVQEKCREFLWQNEAFETMVHSLIESGDYPKKKEDTEIIPEKPKKSNIIFYPETFLNKFPDPEQYFKESKNGKNYKELSFQYLKDRFRFSSVCEIMAVLKANDFNLSTASRTLANSKPSRQTKRTSAEVKMKIPLQDNEDFTAEVYFLENTNEIMSFRAAKELQRQELLHQAMLKGELVTCGCCYDDECIASDTIPCEVGHLFCKSCVKRSAEVIIGDGKVDFPCLTSCSSNFPIDCLKEVLPQNLFEKIDKLKQEQEVQAAGIDGLESCPFCEYAEIPPDGDRLFKCKSCFKESCRQCKKLSHIPLRCEEVVENEKIQGRIFIEDKMTEALVRTCYKCHKKFIKQDGCNKMTCTCGAKMCYLCRKPVKDYSHFYDESQPSENKCPLYSKNDELHVNAVIQAGEAAKNEILQSNRPMDEGYNPFVGLCKTPPRRGPYHGAERRRGQGRLPVHLERHHHHRARYGGRRAELDLPEGLAAIPLLNELFNLRR